MSRDNLGRFKSGNIGGPGRPKGSRNRLAEDFLTDVCADWKQHGIKVIADVRKKYPAVYLRTVASLVPRDQLGPVQGEFSDLTDDELIESVEEEVAKLRHLKTK